MGGFVGESIPVLDEEGGGGRMDDGGGGAGAGAGRRMLGVVFEAAIVKAYLDTMDDVRREENAGA